MAEVIELSSSDESAHEESDEVMEDDEAGSSEEDDEDDDEDEDDAEGEDEDDAMEDSENYAMNSEVSEAPYADAFGLLRAGDAYRKEAIQAIGHNRRRLGNELFFDKLVKQLNIKDGTYFIDESRYTIEADQ
jgi:hypothetical protein